MTKPSKRRRSELERLVDLTILGPTHPELGTCWLFTGTTTPYGRIAKAQDSYTHRLGWKLLRGPIPEGKELHRDCYRTLPIISIMLTASPSPPEDTLPRCRAQPECCPFSLKLALSH